jgi:hypothetical protein
MCTSVQNQILIHKQLNDEQSLVDTHLQRR